MEYHAVIVGVYNIKVTHVKDVVESWVCRFVVFTIGQNWTEKM